MQPAFWCKVSLVIVAHIRQQPSLQLEAADGRRKTKLRVPGDGVAAETTAAAGAKPHQIKHQGTEPHSTTTITRPSAPDPIFYQHSGRVIVVVEWGSVPWCLIW